ncbi:hypothetical protein RJT34_19827 [Clitoria ternatea]|uniref:Uncharacterized protein n=1 Tax=Clitoria ternatea TaxID=43366 RepID=A0AAN9IS71_CLITE
MSITCRTPRVLASGQKLSSHNNSTSTSENGSLIYPTENVSVDNISFPSHWNSSTRSNGYASTSLNIDVPPHQSDASGTSNNHFMHSSSANGKVLLSGYDEIAHDSRFPLSSSFFLSLICSDTEEKRFLEV